MHFHSFENILNAKAEELTNVDEIGERIAESLLSWTGEDENLALLVRLKEAGVQLEVDARLLENKTDILEGKSFVISGVFKNHTRDELKEMIELNGGKNTSSLSKKTNYLLAGEKMGPSKKEKAEKLEIAVLSEEEFMTLLK